MRKRVLHFQILYNYKKMFYTFLTRSKLKINLRNIDDICQNSNFRRSYKNIVDLR